MNPFSENIDGYYNVKNQLPQFLREEAEACFEIATRERAAIESTEDVIERRHIAREYFFDAIGGLPEPASDLAPTVMETLSRDGYLIENVVFQSLPDFHVTTNLYLPSDIDGTVPGVLFFCGHSDSGKTAPLYQKVCIELVKNGFAVLAVDPLGQGERHQYYDPETRTNPRCNVIEHTYLGHQCQLVGANLARYFVNDCIRAFDYLASRPEVDENRIGATGNSGGGMQTAYLMLADDRLAAAAPCCFVTTKEDYMKTGQAQDGEQILFRAIERGPRYDDFISTFAPKPVLIGAAQSDYLCVEGAYRTFERARCAYDLFEAPDSIELTISPTTHGFVSELRTAVVNWFRAHLQEDSSEYEPMDPETEREDVLQCCTDGEINSEYPHESHVIDFNREFHRSQCSSNTEVGESELRRLLRERFALDRESCRRFPRVIETEKKRGLKWEKVFFRSESSIVVTGILVYPPWFEAGVEPTVVLLEHGTESLPEHMDAIVELASQRGAAFVFDPRGIGGVRSSDVNSPRLNGGSYYDYHGTEYKLASDALMLGTSLVAMRTYDVLQAGEFLRDKFDCDSIGIAGAGSGAVYGLYAAVADGSVERVFVEDVDSFEQRATKEEYTPVHGLLMHDIVGSLDLPDLIETLDERGTSVCVERAPISSFIGEL